MTSETRPDSKVVGFQLDANGNRTRITWPDSYYVAYGYDELSRLTSVLENGSTSLASYTYDAASRRSGLTYGNSTTATYGYAANSDLTNVNNVFSGSSVDFGYSYNHVHQNKQMQVSDSSYVLHPSSATSISYTPNDVNQYTAVGAASPTYDGNGNLTGDGVNTYTFDTENRMLTFSKTGHSASYVYDPLGRRFSKTADSVTTNFVSAGNQTIADYDGSGNLSHRYIFGPGIDEPILRIDCSGTGCSTATKYYNHQDGHGSVVALTNSSGTVTETDTYSPYGESTTTSGNPYRFAGMRLDAETGLYYARARYYSPALGRFLSNDPIGYDGGTNLYAYTGNDPINIGDPDGICPQCLAAAAVGGVGGLVVQAGLDLWHGQLSSGSAYAGAFAGGAAGGAAALVCGPACAGAAAGAASNFVTQSINAAYGGNVSATSFAVDTAMGALGGKIAGAAVPYAFKNFVSNGVKGDIGETLTATDLFLRGETIAASPAANNFGRSSFDFQLTSGQFVESKFGTSTLSWAQRQAAQLPGNSLELQTWSYPTVSGMVGAGIGGGMASGSFGLK